MARILLGVSGGIAAYKALEVVRLATGAGHAVRVIQTASSSRFVGRASFAALSGAPGIYSARWSGPNRDFGHAMALVEQRLEETRSEDRSAWFTSALAVAWPNGPAVVVEGRVDGRLTFPPRGDKGFGYDPIFLPETESRTFGEMDEVEKDRFSHRSRAFAKLKAALLD